MACDCEEEITVVRLLSNGCYYSVFFLAVLWVDEWPVIVKKGHTTVISSSQSQATHQQHCEKEHRIITAI